VCCCVVILKHKFKTISESFTMFVLKIIVHFFLPQIQGFIQKITFPK